MRVYRLARGPYAKNLSGKGAAIKGARWNSIGVEMVYTAESRSLAMAEVAVHLSIGTLPDDYMMVTIEIPDNLAMNDILLYTLPANWNVFPYLSSTQIIGDEFIRNNIVPVLKVPSAVVQGEFNLLLNPFHPDFKRISIEEIVKFPLDVRIFH